MAGTCVTKNDVHIHRRITRLQLNVPPDWHNGKYEEKPTDLIN